MQRKLLKLLFWPECLVPWAKRSGWARFRFVRTLIDFLLLPADWRIVSSIVLKQTGHRPNWLRRPGFSEWITRSKLTNRHRVHTIWADKLAVRDWLEKRGYGHYLTKLLWRGFDLNEARMLDLPQKFVIKANHTSGSVIVVKDSSTFDWDTAIAESKKWLATDYSASSAEWQYRWIIPELFIEEYLEQPDGLLLDYKIHCFHGNPTMIQVIDRAGTHCECCYDIYWNNLHWNLTYPLLATAIREPDNLEEMFGICRSLAQSCLYVRIDLYEVANRVIFGEITLHPGGGGLPRMAPECERQMATWLWKDKPNE